MVLGLNTLIRCRNCLWWKASNDSNLLCSRPQVPQLYMGTGFTKALYSLSLLLLLFRSLLHHTDIRVRYAAAASCFLQDTSCKSPSRDPRDLVDLHSSWPRWFGSSARISWVHSVFAVLTVRSHSDSTSVMISRAFSRWVWLVSMKSTSMHMQFHWENL